MVKITLGYPGMMVKLPWEVVENTNHCHWPTLQILPHSLPSFSDEAQATQRINTIVKADSSGISIRD